MDRNELILFLNSINVNNERYSFDRIENFECISLLKEGVNWNVYYTERDKPELIAQFDNESDANLFVANDFKRQM